MQQIYGGVQQQLMGRLILFSKRDPPINMNRGHRLPRELLTEEGIEYCEQVVHPLYTLLRSHNVAGLHG